MKIATVHSAVPFSAPCLLARRFLLVAVFALAQLLPSAVPAVTTLSGNIVELSGPDWAIQGLTWSIRTDDQSSLKIQSLSISQLPLTLSEIVLSCSQSTLTTRGGQCEKGTLSARLGQDRITGQWRANAAPDGVGAWVSLALAGGEVTVNVGRQSPGLLDISLTNLSLADLRALWSAGGDITMPGVDANLSADLKVIVPTEADRNRDTNLVIDGNWRIDNLSFDLNDGTLAGAALVMSGSVVATSGEDRPLAASAEVSIHDGELLVDPAYINFAEVPDLTVEIDTSLIAEGGVRIKRWQVSDGDSLTAKGTALVSAEGKIQQAELILETLTLAQAWPRYISAISDSRGFAGLTGEGSVQAQLNITDAGLAHVSVAADNVSLAMDNGRFGIQQLDGVVDYSVAGDSADSNLSWESVSYYTLVIGEASSRFFVGGGQLQLLESLFLPVLDGGLKIDELVVDNLGTAQTAMDFRGELKPMALDRITRALDWPELQGTLGGSIPQVRLRNQVVEVGGAVVIEVFGGQITMNQLKLERIFGVLPTLAADVTIADVDLEQMTGAFSFGKIEGVLEGEVSGLRLLDWRPVAFDLDLHTKRDSGVRQRISQRAVDNLSSIGGGVAALGSTVLRIFDDFGYQQLGLSCALRNNTCTMGGVGDAGNGYYLVRGSGIPRIDIKGFSRRVDWPQLVRRLKAATESGPVSVE